MKYKGKRKRKTKFKSGDKVRIMCLHLFHKPRPNFDSNKWEVVEVSLNEKDSVWRATLRNINNPEIIKIAATNRIEFLKEETDAE